MLKLKGKRSANNGTKGNDEKYQYFRSKLHIDKDALDQAVAEHPFLLQEVGERYNLACSLRDEAKEQMERKAAQLALDIRKVFGKDAKITNDEVNSRVSLDKHYIAASDNYFALAKETANWFTLRESFLSRGYMIRELCGLYATSYWTKNSTTGGSVDDVRTGAVRKAQRQPYRS